MFEIKVTVDIPALDRLTAKLDAYIAAKGADVKATTAPPVIPYTAPDMPMPDPNTVQPTVTAPTPVVPPVAAPVTSAPAFTLAQVARAGAQLLTAKPALQNDLMALLGRYGAKTAQDLPQDRLGEFAAELRQMGAQI